MSQRNVIGIRLALVMSTVAMSAGAPDGVGQQGAATIAAADHQACEQASAWAASHPGSGRLFGGTWQENSRSLTWREYPSQAELDKVVGATVFNVGSVWVLPSGGLFVQTVASSFSGDWALYVSYCFRGSGDAIAITSELRVLPGETITKEAIEFGGNGNELSRRTSYYDLTSNGELAGEAAVRAKEWKARFPTPVYKRTSDLPFHGLLRPDR
jgi:hypothetical protein